MQGSCCHCWELEEHPLHNATPEKAEGPRGVWSAPTGSVDLSQGIEVPIALGDGEPAIQLVA